MKMFNRIPWGYKVLAVMWLVALVVNPLTGQLFNSGIVWALQHLILAADKGFELAFKYISYWATIAASVSTLIYISFRYGQHNSVNIPSKSANTQKAGKMIVTGRTATKVQ
jgi:hypothetical protein